MYGLFGICCLLLFIVLCLLRFWLLLLVGIIVDSVAYVLYTYLPLFVVLVIACWFGLVVCFVGFVVYCACIWLCFDLWIFVCFVLVVLNYVSLCCLLF